jgi:putative phosphoribosyl transferase
MFFENRVDAGKKLAEAMRKTGEDFSGYTVVGIARGGVIVGAEIAKLFNLPLQSIYIDDFVEDKGEWFVTSFGSGAFLALEKESVLEFIGSINTRTQDERLLDFIKKVRLRNSYFNRDRSLNATKVILCDDGLVSGTSLFVVQYALRLHGVKDILAAIPVVPQWFAEQKDIRFITWRISRLIKPTSGIFYFNFKDTEDEDIRKAIEENIEKN